MDGTIDASNTGAHWKRRLTALASLFPLFAAAAGGVFHTDPACWEAPRIYHSASVPPELDARIRLERFDGDLPASAVIETAPNDAYRFGLVQPDTSRPPPWRAEVWLEVERPQAWRLTVDEIAGPILASWINEKLVFLRLPFGRMVFVDLVLDAESGEILYREAAHDGRIAFEQFREACGGRCPCEVDGDDPVAGNADAAVVVQRGPTPASVIGLLTIPGLFPEPESGGVDPEYAGEVVAIHAAPEGTAVATVNRPADLEHREYTYEGAAAVVRERRGAWFRVALTDAPGEGWVPSLGGREFLPVEKLLGSRLAYLNQRWNGRLWSVPGTAAADLPPLGTRERETAIRVLDSRWQGDRLWLRVEVLDANPCETPQAGVRAGGWVPAHDREGRLQAWFHSRGC